MVVAEADLALEAGVLAELVAGLALEALSLDHLGKNNFIPICQEKNQATKKIS